VPSRAERKADVAIVGAGVIGLACAWRAAQRGLEVVVLDRLTPASGATGVAAGMLAPVGELEFGEQRLLEMTLAAAEQYPGFVAELEEASGLPAGYRRFGALHVALDRDEAAELRRRHELQRSLGLSAEWLAPRACRELEPGLAPSIAGGVHASEEGAVDPRELCAALLAALERAGAEVRSGAAVAEALIDGDRIEGVVTEAGDRIRAGAVVLAVGAWAGAAQWLPEAARPPVRPVKGQILTLRGPAAEPVCERIVASERVYVVPRGDGHLVVGATVEEQGFDVTVTAGGVHELLREAYRLLPEISELELLEATAGLRPGTPDNLPLIGPGALDGLVLATGHYRNGVLLAPLTADRVAETLAGAEVTA
jgi:glycine oxidase